MELERAKSRRGEKSTKLKLSGRMTVYFLTLYRFQGSRKAKPDMYFENCTARWKKHLVKKPVANVFKRTHERRNANNFAVGLRRNKLTKIEKSIL